MYKGNTFQEYIETFKKNNPDIPLSMMGLPSQDYNTGEEYSGKKEDHDNENDMEDTYFNYNYNYDFVPEWTNNDATEKQSDG